MHDRLLRQNARTQVRRVREESIYLLKGTSRAGNLNRLCRGLLFQRPEVYCFAQPEHYKSS